MHADIEMPIPIGAPAMRFLSRLDPIALTYEIAWSAIVLGVRTRDPGLAEALAGPEEFALQYDIAVRRADVVRRQIGIPAIAGEA